ncbi:MAG: STAS domain-containing protein [Cyclobacteriaceae bacterium]
MTFDAGVSGQKLLIRFHGDLTGDGKSEDLEAVVEREITTGVRICIADLSGVRYMNSSGIGIFLRMFTRFRNKGGEMYLINPPEHLSRLLVVSKLQSLFPIINSADEVPSPEGKP